jgi:hypothetical protein
MSSQRWFAKGKAKSWIQKFLELARINPSPKYQIVAAKLYIKKFAFSRGGFQILRLKKKEGEKSLS